MKWSTAVGHVRRLAEQCTERAEMPSGVSPIPVTELWAVGDVLGEPRELDWVTVALCVDLPAAEVPWLFRSDGADHWADLTRASKNPVGLWWRSSRAPVWNHRIVRPVLVWDQTEGIRENALTALADGRGAFVGMARPSEEEFVARMSDELQTSLGELRRRTQEYESDQFTRLAVRGDRLHAAAQGYLDVLSAVPPVDPMDSGDDTTADQAAPAMKAATT